MLFRINKQHLLHVKASQMPEVIHGSQAVEMVWDERLATCLGVAVVLAGYDHVVACFGTELDVDHIFDSSGIARVLVIRREKAGLSERRYQAGVLWRKSVWRWILCRVLKYFGCCCSRNMGATMARY